MKRQGSLRFSVVLAASMVGTTATAAAQGSPRTMVVTKEFAHWMHGHQSPMYDSPTEIDGAPIHLDSVRANDPRPLGDRSDAVAFGKRLHLISPMLAPAPPPGRRRTTPITFSVGSDSVGFAVRGTRTSWVVRDSMIDGVGYVLVRDSAAVTFAEATQAVPRTLGRPIHTRRSGQGTIVGFRLVDPRLSRAVWLADTTSLTGTAQLHYPDGRSWTSPARYVGVQQSELVDTQTYRLRQETASRQNRGIGMVHHDPLGGLEARLHRGERWARDSLWSLFGTSRRAEQRDSIAELLRFNWRLDPVAHDSLREIALAAGDSARVIKDLVNDWDLVGGLRARFYPLYRLPMAEPGYAFSHGFGPDGFYENAAQRLVENPPALFTDPRNWPCEPAACQMLAAERDNPRVDPRLRDLAIVAAFVLDPKRWVDTIIALDAAGHHLVRGAARLARGIVSPSDVPIPDPHAPWNEWVHWMHGQAPGAPSAPLRLPNPEFLAITPTGRAYAHAIRINEILTEQQFAPAFRQQLATAPSDTARLVFGTLLAQLGEPPRDAQALVRALTDGTALDRMIAREEVARLVSEDGTPADDATATDIGTELLAAMLHGGPQWTPLGDSVEWGNYSRGLIDLRSNRLPSYFTANGLPDSVRAIAATAGFTLTDGSWRLPAEDSGLILSVSPIIQAGPFVRVRVNVTWLVRLPDGRGDGDSHGYELLLMRTASGWVRIANL